MPPKGIMRRDELLFLILWSSGYIGAKYGLPHAGTFTLLFWRYALLLVLVGMIVTWRNEWQRATMQAFTLGFLGHFVWLVVILKAFEYGISAGAAALIAAMQPALTALLAPIILSERTTMMQWVGIGLGFAGVATFVLADQALTGSQLWVYLLPAIATISLTTLTLSERRQSQIIKSELPIFTSLFWQGFITAALLLPLGYWFEGLHVNWNGEIVFAIGWLGIVVSIMAYAIMLQLIRTRTATRVSALQFFVPPTTMIIAWIVFQESLTILGLVGLAITSSGFYLMHKGQETTPSE
ncbi:DMT family transporter [Alphaproteobacteria bacterium]|nr:DMT family transporter [Alphaproteobacteria bacterium]